MPAWQRNWALVLTLWPYICHKLETVEEMAAWLTDKHIRISVSETKWKEHLLIALFSAEPKQACWISFKEKNP